MQTYLSFLWFVVALNLIKMSEAEFSDPKTDPFNCDGDDKDADADYVPEPKDQKTPKTTKLSVKKYKKSMDKDKKKMAKLVDGEEVIWNLKHKLHSNANAVAAAWKRIAEQMNRKGRTNQHLTANDAHATCTLHIYKILFLRSVRLQEIVQEPT